MRWLWSALLLVACTEELRVLDREADTSRPDCSCDEGELCAVDACVDPSGVMPLGVGYRHACRVRDGELECWGENRVGQLGLSDTSDRQAPERVGDGSSWLAVAAAEEHTCAIAAPGRMYCWGSNGAGQLGIRNTTSQRQPTRVVGFDDFEAVFCGGQSSCALRRGGQLYCWGATGELLSGTGDVPSPETVDQPVAVLPDNRFVTASLGALHSCAVRDDGALLCWGQNGDGQLGIGSTSSAAKRPTQVARMGWEQVSAGRHHTCGVRDGQLYCWGRGDSFELGTGSRRSVTSPARVGDADDWDSVSVGEAHTCARTRDRTVYCWGRNGEGQLGRTPSEPVAEPAPVRAGYRFSEVAVGSRHSCAVDTGLQVFCWGANDAGQLGLGDTMPRYTPTMLD